MTNDRRRCRFRQVSANLHRITGGITARKRAAITGPCRLHPERPAVGFVLGTDFMPRGACEDCLATGERLGYETGREA